MLNIPKKSYHQRGFSLIELTIAISVLGILSSIALVNLSSSWANSRLLTTTRSLENWLNQQRSYAKTHNLTCFISIDPINKRVSSIKYASEKMEPCIPSSRGATVDEFDISEKFGQDGDKLRLEMEPQIDPSHNQGGILFSLQGLSQNHQLVSQEESEEESEEESDGKFELRLVHPGLQTVRCIRIISPIGMIRDGRKDNNQSDCQYDKTN